jgi:hypothetical protein
MAPLAIGVMLAFAVLDIATADGIAKKICIIENSHGATIQQIDAPNGSEAAAFCIEYMKKFVADGPKEISVRLACFTHGVPDWTDGFHELRSPPCQRLR